MSNLGLCFSGGAYEDWRWYNPNGYHTIILRGNMRHVRVIGAAQYTEALQRVQSIRAKTHVHFRHMIHVPPGGDKKTDDGMWKLPVQEWIDNIYFAHGYDKYRMHVQWDNEFSTDNLDVLGQYVHSGVQLARAAGQRDMRLDMLSFPTHWPAYHDQTKDWLAQGHFDDLFRAIAANQGSDDTPRIWCVPNAYIHEQNLDGIRNVIAIWRRFKDVTGVAPHMALGEYAWSRITADGQFDPHGGYAAEDRNPETVIDFCVDTFETKLLSYGIGAMLYTVGYLGGNEVKTFHFDNGPLNVYAVKIAQMAEPTPPLPEPEPVITLPIPTTPPDDDEDTVEVPTLPAFERKTLERQVLKYRALAQSIKAQQALLDASAQEVQALILRCELELELLDDAADAAA